MSFAGHAFAAIKSLEANRSLYKKESFFRDAAFYPKWDKFHSFNFRTPSAKEVEMNKERNLAYFENERRKSRVGILVASLFALVIVVALAVFLF